MLEKNQRFISRLFYNPNEDLHCGNGLTDVSYICTSSLAPKCVITHTLTLIDTIESIIKAYNLTLKEFSSANPFIDRSNLLPCQVVCVKAFVQDEKLSLSNPLFGKLIKKFKNEKNTSKDIDELIQKPNRANVKKLVDNVLKSFKDPKGSAKGWF
jgi:hypothetical protein